MPKFIPNLLTLFRLLLIPVFVLAYFLWSPSESKLFPMGIFILATASDVLDGYIARKYELITKLGTVLDPLADKLMLLTALVCLYLDNKIPTLIILLVLAKECFMIVAGTYLYFAKDKIVIPANRLGKLASIIFFGVVISVLLGANSILQTLLMLMALMTTFIAMSSYIRTYKQTHA